MNIEANPTVATSARTRRTVLSVAIAVITTIPIAAGSSAASDETTSPDTTESTVDTQGDTNIESVPTAIANGWVAFAAYDSQFATDLYLVRDNSDAARRRF